MACTCKKVKVGKGKGKVQGYAIVELCEECLAQRAVDAIAQAENKKYEDANLLIAQKARQIAEDALTTEGKIESINGKMRIKDETKR